MHSSEISLVFEHSLYVDCWILSLCSLLSGISSSISASPEFCFLIPQATKSCVASGEPLEEKRNKCASNSEKFLSFVGYIIFSFLILVDLLRISRTLFIFNPEIIIVICRRFSQTSYSAISEWNLIHACLNETKNRQLEALDSWACSVIGFTVRFWEKSGFLLLESILIVSIHRSLSPWII